MKIQCVECGEAHTTGEIPERPFFGDGKSYYCPVTEKEIAREKDKRFVVWNGREYRSG